MVLRWFLMLLPSLSMDFDGSGPLVKRCDGFDGLLWSKTDNHDVDRNGDGKMTFLKWTYTPYSKALPHHQTQAQCEFCHYPCTWPPKWIRRIVWYFLIRQTKTDLKSKVWLKTSFVNPPIAKKWCSASAQDSLQFGLNNRKSYIFNASWRDLILVIERGLLHLKSSLKDKTVVSLRTKNSSKATCSTTFSDILLVAQARVAEVGSTFLPKDFQEDATNLNIAYVRA